LNVLINILDNFKHQTAKASSINLTDWRWMLYS